MSILSLRILALLLIPITLFAQHAHDHHNHEDKLDIEAFIRSNFRGDYLENKLVSWPGNSISYHIVYKKVIQLQKTEEHKVWHLNAHEFSKPKNKKQIIQRIDSVLHQLIESERASLLSLGEPVYIAQNTSAKTEDDVEDDEACTNLDFESCDFSGWNQYEGFVDPNPFGYIGVTPVNNWNAINNIFLANTQHSIVNGGIDASVGIPMVRPGGSCSALIGDGLGDGGRAASINKTFQVTPDNYNFYYSYAIVMENPNHTLGEQPFFRIRMYDDQGNSISCAELDVFAGDGNPEWANTNGYDYIDWQSAFIPLQQYIGQDVTIEFTAGDCDLGGHICYAYVEAECNRPIELSDTATCRGNPVTISAPDGALSYSWSNGENTREIIVEDSGWYKVTMQGTAGGACFTEDSSYVGYYPKPIAVFSADTSCVEEFKLFVDASTSDRTINQWSWDFDNDGNEDSNQQNPTHQFNQGGLFPVQLLITTVNNCIDDTTANVLVSDPPEPDFRFLRTCDGDSLELINQTDTDNIDFEWRYTGTPFSNSINTAYLFPYDGDYAVELWLENEFGCRDSLSKIVTVNPVPQADYSYVPVCFPNNTQFTNTSTINSGNITTYSWDFEVSQSILENPLVDFDSSGTYQTKLVITSDSGCVDSIIKPVEHYDRPNADFSFDTACFSFETQLNDLSSSKDTIVSWQWDFDNNLIFDNAAQNPVHIFPATGAQPVQLGVTTNHGCYKDTTISVFVAELPDPDFTVNSNCLYDSVFYTNQSDPSYSFNWIHDVNNYDYDDQNFNSSKLFDAQGTYTTRLIARNNFGCLDSTDSTYQVHPLPQASFDFTEVCYPFETNFASTSSIPDGNINFYRWEYGNGNVASGIQNASQFYQSSGTYDVKLYIESDFGCRDSITHQIEHFEKPVADFSVADFCLYDSVSVVNTSTTVSDAIVLNEWLSNNVSDNRFEAKFKYDNYGEQQITLVVTTENNCKDTLSDTTYIHAIPNADFDFENVCAFADWNGVNTSTIDDGNLQSYLWNIENDTWNDENITTVFDRHGTYDVQLIASSDFNCKDTILQTITIHPLPLVTFEITNSCAPEPVEVKALSTVTNGPTNQIANHNWNLGDGAQDTGSEISHNYDSFGSYDIKLVSITNNGCSDSAEQTATVHPKPIANFGSNLQDGCSEWCVELFDLSTVGSGQIQRREWVFEDIDNTEDSIVTSCFYNDTDIPQNYDIRLIVESDQGCKDDTISEDYITVYPNAHADFDYQPYELTENNSGAYFQNWSRTADDFTWYMGDSTMIREFEPYHEFEEPGEYMVTLIANNEYNCPDTISKPLEVEPVYSYFIPNTFTPNNDGLNDEFFVKQYNIVYIELYIFNRWGELIYQEEGASPRWDGTLNGNIVQIDTYVYKAFLTDIFNKKHEVVGHVNVIR